MAGRRRGLRGLFAEARNRFYGKGRHSPNKIQKIEKRNRIYQIMKDRNSGFVPCFVCGSHVSEDNVTLEHIKPVSKGGTDDMSNLAISHLYCNQRKGNSETFPVAGNGYAGPKMQHKQKIKGEQ